MIVRCCFYTLCQTGIEKTAGGGLLFFCFFVLFFRSDDHSQGQHKVEPILTRSLYDRGSGG